MKLTPRRMPRWFLCLTCVLLAFLMSGSDSFAHRRPWRHVHRRRVLVVGRPVAVQQVVTIDGKPHGTVDFNVEPSTTELYVDGRLRGTVDDFDGRPQKLHLIPGVHTIGLRPPDGDKVSRTFSIQAGTEIEVQLDLEEQAGTD